MRHYAVWAAMGAAMALSGCGAMRGDDAVDRGLQGVNAVDETNLTEVMLTVGDPNEAVAYFQRTLGENPDRLDLRRGLAASLVRARRIDEAQTA